MKVRTSKKQVLQDLLTLPKNVLAAITFGVELMRLAGLPILFTVARRIGEHIVLTSTWLNEQVARELPDYDHLPNPEYAGLKLLNIFRVKGVEKGFRLSPFQPHKQSACKTKGGASQDGFGFASSFLDPHQDLLVTMLLLLHAFVGRLKIVSVDVLNLGAADEYQKEMHRKLNISKSTDVRGLSVVWNLSIKAEKYVKAVELLKGAFGGGLVETADRVSFSFFDSDPERTRFFGQLTLGFTLTRAA